MKAHLFAISLWGLTARAAGHHDAAVLEARQAFPSDAAVSVCYTFTSTYLTLVTPSSSSATAAPTTTPGLIPIILQVEPLTVAKRGLQKRSLEKRAGLGGYVSDNPADPNPSDCSGATIFELGTVLLDRGLPLFTEAGDPFAEFRSTGPPPADAITTTFSGVVGGTLSWANTAFLTGEAVFCQVPATGQVFSTFEGDLNVPAGCVTVQLRVLAATSCQNGNIVSSSGSPSPSSAPLTEVTQVVTASSSTFTETVPVTEIVVTSSSTTFTESVPVTDVVVTSSSTTFTESVPVIPTPPPSSSASQIIITSTSTETVFMMSSTSAGPTATACPFTTSGSLLTDGGFENGPGDTVFSYAPLGLLPNDNTQKRNRVHRLSKKQVPTAEEVHAIDVVLASTAPRQLDGACNYVLEISYPGGTEETEDVYGVTLPFTLTLQTYTISFDILACGNDGSVTVTVNEFSVTIDNEDCSAGTGAAWQTFTGTFSALGLGLDILYLDVVGDLDVSEDYFDNFIITAGGTVAASSSSVAPLATPVLKARKGGY